MKRMEKEKIDPAFKFAMMVMAMCYPLKFPGLIDRKEFISEFTSLAEWTVDHMEDYRNAIKVIAKKFNLKEFKEK